jgi:hypothetical protein
MPTKRRRRRFRTTIRRRRQTPRYGGNGFDTSPFLPTWSVGGTNNFVGPMSVSAGGGSNPYSMI